MANTTKTLGKLFLKLELRTKDGSGRKLFLLILSYLLTGLFLPILIYKQNTDPTGFEFAFLTFLFYSMIVVFTSVTELDNLIISKSESDTLSLFPLQDNLIVNAKMYVLRRYIFIISLPLLLPGAFFYYLLLRSLSHAILYIVAGILVNTFVLTLLLLLYSAALRRFRIERIASYTLVFQILIILAMVLGYQYISYSLSVGPSTNIGTIFSFLESGSFLRFFPHSWFAFIAAGGNYVLNYKLILKIILPFFLTSMAWLSLKLYLTDNFGRIHEKFMLSGSVNVRRETSDMNRRIPFLRFVSRISRFYLNNNPQEQSSFSLMRSMFRRDKAVRLNILLMTVIPAALALFAMITNQLPSPFKQFYLTSRPVFHISIMVTIFIVINTAIVSVKVTSDPQASWIYRAYPMGAGKNFRNGVKKFFFVFLVLPVCVVLFTICFIKMPLKDALLHSLFILAAASLLNTIYHGFIKTLPFTKTNSLLASLQRVGSLIFPVGYGIVLAVIQYFVYQTFTGVILSILILMALNFTMARLMLKNA